MQSKRFLLFLILLVLGTGLTACLSLAEDVTPPPGYQPSLAQEAADGPVYPMLPPDPKRGEPIYAEKCAPCHGDAGLGDGPDADQLSTPVTALGSLAVVRQSIPADWYNIVAKGKLDRNMPPFASLSVSERWDVIAYAYTLSIPADVLAQGKALYERNCLSCHGERGQGDGPAAGGLADSPIDFTDQAFMGERSAGDLFQSVTNGVGSMPAFDDLSEDERWALAAYLRSLSFAPPEVESESLGEGRQPEAYPAPYPAPGEVVDLPTPEVTELQEEEIGTVRVRIVHATNGEIPPGLDVVLYGYDQMTTQVFSRTMRLDTEGFAEFTGIPMPEGWILFATATHNEITYGSEIVTLDSKTNSIDLQVDYYDPSNDISLIKADRLHVFFSFDSEETVEVFILYVFSNLSQNVIVTEDMAPVVEFSLPGEATNLQVQESTQLALIKTEAGFGVLDVYPSTSPYQIVYSFDMPYPKDKLDLSLPIGLDTTAVIVMTPEEGVKINSDQLQDAGMRDVEGVSFSMYNGGNLSVGDSLNLSVSGRPDETANIFASNQADNHTGLVVGLVVFSVVLIGAGIYLWRRNQQDKSDLLEDGFEVEDVSVDATPGDLMDAIIALDDLYQAGDLPGDAYRQRRAELKEQLRKILEP
jgi:mono/diheme cytochrome c family protein